MIDLKYATHSRNPFFLLAKQYIYKNDKVLDVGAGDGSFADFIGEEDIFLLEGNDKSFENLSKRYKNVFHSRIPHLPFENSFFDVIHMSHVIEHLYPQEVYDVLSEFDRCLKKGGRIIISAPLLWSGFYDDLSHIRPYPPESFIKYLSGLGSNPTRKGISENYKVDKLVYRYNPSESLIRKRSLHSTFDKILYKINTFILKTQIFYERTGYTIILVKS